MTGKIVFGKEGQPDHYFVDGKEVAEAEFRNVFPAQSLAGGAFGGHLPGCWPLASDALGVHPTQIAEAEEDARQKGVPTEFLPDGRAVLTDRGHRKRYLKAYGFRDNNGGYGD